MSVHLGPARLPGLEIEVDLEPRLLLAERSRNRDDNRVVALDRDLAVGSPQEIDEILPGFGWDLNPHPQFDSEWSISAVLSNFEEFCG